MKIVLLFFTVILAGCFATSPNQGTRIDEVAMYGGMDRSKYPDLKIGDEKFISDVTDRFGSREKASKLWVEQGFKFYSQNNLGMAMRRFNQAWLLDPKNPEVFAGFGSVLHDQGKNCESMRMMEKSLSLNPPTFQGIYPDAARIFTLCAVSDKTLTTEEKSNLISNSEELYKKAEEVEPNKEYVYGSWATAYYWRGEYAKSWSMVAKQRESGGKLGEKFMNLLRSKMPEPN